MSSGAVPAAFNPREFAILWYFGDLQYWKLPQIATDALEAGYDGPALRWIAGLSEPVSTDISSAEVDAAFREMGVAAPITKEQAQFALAIEAARRVANGSNVFDEATHVRIHLCGLAASPDFLQRIVDLSREATNAPRWRWAAIEADIVGAFSELLTRQPPDAAR